MSWIELFLYPLSPVLALATTGVGLMTAECFRTQMPRFKYWLALSGAVVSLVFVGMLWASGPSPLAVQYSGEASWLNEFVHTYRFDRATVGFFGGIAVFTLLSLVLMSAYFERSEARTEVLALTLFVATGMMLLVSADSLIMVFLALELLSLPTYVLVGIRHLDRQSGEAALKYFLFGSFATVLLVFGIALLYGQYGTLEIPKLTDAIRSGTVGVPQGLVLGSLALLLVATAFKIGVVPFHMWIPDAYQGAPTPVTAFMGSAVKLAGFGLTIRLLWGVFLPLADVWMPTIAVLAVASMFVGNLAALVQDDLKRMFAYSSISHAGYLLLGITAIGKYGPPLDAVYYYLLAYGFMFVGFFGVLLLIERAAKTTDIYAILGLGFEKPFWGGCLALFALSSAGIPPTAGFFAKYFVFVEAVRAGQTWLVVLGVISSLIGAYYYLRVIVYLYMREGRDKVAIRSPRWTYTAVIVLCAAAMLVMALAPGIATLSPPQP